jgi:hypothetical protein
VDVPRIQNLGSTRGGYMFHVRNQRRPNSGLPSERRKIQSSGKGPSCWHHCGHTARPAGHRRRIGMQEGGLIQGSMVGQNRHIKVGHKFTPSPSWKISRQLVSPRGVRPSQSPEHDLSCPSPGTEHWGRGGAARAVR